MSEQEKPTYVVTGAPIIGIGANTLDGGDGCVWNTICAGSYNTIESTAHHSIILFGKGITVSEPYELAFGFFGRVWRLKMTHAQWERIHGAILTYFDLRSRILKKFKPETK